jgi:hypothetical protein
MLKNKYTLNIFKPKIFKLIVLKLIIFKLITFNPLQKLSLYKNCPLLKLKKYNHATKEEEDLISILFILILLTSLYFYKRIATINNLKCSVKKKLQD